MEETWQQTKIWDLINTKGDENSDKIKTLLKNVMPIIEKTLSVGETSPKDFTLHDQMHSYRVAQRMHEIIPTSTLQVLSIYELAILLLSAYCHDVGMTPEYKKVKEHYECLLWGNKKMHLIPEELKEFQKWLDDQNENAEIPLAIDGKVDRETLAKAQKLLTYYSREKHNAWSEDWIRKKLKTDFDKVRALYATFLDDLIDICKSHHEGLVDLERTKFDPIPVSDSVVHKRYLAMCLRVADVMENDAERTPEVVFNHRDIDESSIVYWQKDAPLVLSLKDYKVSAYAKLEKAYLEKAVRETVQNIEDQLRLCAILQERKPLSNFAPYNNLKHEWKLIPDIHKTIGPKEHTYEFIDGAFRPNTKKILELLSGTALYGNRMLAIRELLQNAFDAVKEIIAYERLGREKPENCDWEKKLGDLRQVSLLIEEKDSEIWLTCKDDGLGMSKEILNSYFLISGTSKRHQVRDLERRCIENGFSLERTGKFGIGVLSYFMIADRIKIKTRRSLKAGDSDNQTWSFEISGLSDFGELMKIDDSEFEGTEISLRIKKTEAEKGMELIISEIENLIESYIITCPCVFSFKLGNTNFIKMTTQTGWCHDIEYYQNKIENQFREKLGQSFKNNAFQYAFLSNDEKIMWDMIKDQREPLIKAMLSTLKWEIITGAIEGKIKYKIAIPYFELIGGDSLVFLNPKKFSNEDYILSALGDTIVTFIPTESVSYSYKGMKIASSSSGPELLHIDIINGDLGDISVSRNLINSHPEVSKLTTKIEELQNAWKQDFTKRRVKSYQGESSVRKNSSIDEAIKLRWVTQKEDNYHLMPITGKFLIGLSGDIGNKDFEFPFPYLTPKRDLNSSIYGDLRTRLLIYCKLKPQRIIISQELFMEFDTAMIENQKKELSDYWFCSFPQNWKDCIGIFSSGLIILNPENAVVSSANLATVKTLVSQIGQNTEISLTTDFSKSTEEFSNLFLTLMINKIRVSESMKGVWKGLVDYVGGEEKMKAILRNYSFSNNSIFFIEGYGRLHEINTISLDYDESYSSYGHLPDPGATWKMRYKYDRNADLWYELWK